MVAIMRRFALFGLVLAAAPSLAQREGVISLGVGQQKILQLGNVARVAIGEPEVADVKQVGSGGELLLTGIGEGRTSLLVWRKNDTRLSYVVVVRKLGHPLHPELGLGAIGEGGTRVLNRELVAELLTN